MQHFEEDSFIISALLLGNYQNFIHTVFDRQSKRMLVIDPAWDVDAIIAHAKSLDCQITDIIMTHAHWDHNNGVHELIEKTKCSLNMHPDEIKIWDPQFEETKFFSDNDIFKLGETKIKLIHTPGHTPGGTCLHLGDHLIAGDTLFVYGCGRCDLPGSNVNVMFDSLNKLKCLPPETVIHPGHDYGITATSTIAEQIAGNPFLLCKSKEEFIEFRMNGPKRQTPYGPAK